MACRVGTRKVGGRCVKASTYEVVVGNIGTVYKGKAKRLALKDYTNYIGQSQSGGGKAAGEPVTLLADDDIIKEYLPQGRTYQEEVEAEYGL
jgi:hypothetical protein